MPWSSGDVEKHKKGLSPAEKEKWCSIANGVLKSCQEKGGADCEASAIRIANSRVGPTGNVEAARRAVTKYVEVYGGEGSGHFGHAGIPGHQGGSVKGSGGKEPELTNEDKALMRVTKNLLSDGYKAVSYKDAKERGREVADLLNGTSIFEGTVFSSHFSGFQVKDGKYVSLYFPGISVGSGETNARMQRAVAYLNKNGVKARIVDDINFRGIVCNSEQTDLETYALLQDNTLMRTKILEGRKHLVLPVVMMVEGVHNGSHGRLLHLAEDLGKFPGSWDGIPVMVGHPQKDGQNISANSPDVIERSVGRVYNTQMVGGKLKAEVWVDEQKIQSISPEAMEYIRKGSPLEVSVGVFTDEQSENGDWKGEAYVAVAKNHRPDHLALLPGDRGACSWDDGCGIRTNKGKWEQDDEENPEDKKKEDEEEEKRPFDKALEKFKDKSKKKKFPTKAIEKFNEIKRR